MTLSFKVPGEPVAKGRPRFRCLKKYVSTYTPKKTLLAEKAVLDAFKSAYPSFKKLLEGPIRLIVHFYMPVPKSLSNRKKEHLYGKPHLKRPDTDNLLKTVCDALNGHVWKDDSQIFSISTEKLYIREGSYTAVWIEEIDTGE